MKKGLRAVVIMSAMIAAGCTAVGADKKTGHGMMGSGKSMMCMQNLDGNGDGLISKEEFMKSHEQMFESMKDKNGMIDMKSMSKRCGMMGGMMGDGKTDHGHMSKPSR